MSGYRASVGVKRVGGKLKTRSSDLRTVTPATAGRGEMLVMLGTPGPHPRAHQPPASRRRSGLWWRSRGWWVTELGNWITAWRCASTRPRRGTITPTSTGTWCFLSFLSSWSRLYLTGSSQSGPTRTCRSISKTSYAYANMHQPENHIPIIFFSLKLIREVFKKMWKISQPLLLLG